MDSFPNHNALDSRDTSPSILSVSRSAEMSGPSSSGKSTDNSHSLEASYLKWITRQMEKRVVEYSESTQINIFCGTWNVNAREMPESCYLHEWLLPPSSPPCDLYVVGLQEMVDLNVLNVVLNSRSSDEMSLYWIEKLSVVLNANLRGDKYVMIQEKHMVGLECLIFAKDSLLPFIKDIRTSVVFTGGRGLTGNKGGIAVRMDVHDSALCFVCAHFHADRDGVAVRNADFQTILENSVLAPTTTSRKADEDSYSSRHQSVNLSVLNHEQVYWLGDLNYRISEEVETAEVFEKVLAGEWEYLRCRDQLTMERAKGNVFQGFEEGVLTFPPTYKYQPGTGVYETRPEKKLRAPAWCDRVLWRCADKSAVKQLSYQRTLLNASDHMPVSANFTSNVRRIIPSKMKTVYQELLLTVDKWINASAPKIDVTGRMIDLGHVTIKEKYKFKITVVNIGTVMAEWQFVPKNDELLVCKPWIKLYPSDGILAPNEGSEVEVTIDVSLEQAYEILNTPKDSNNDLLEDIFVLHVKKGSDFFCIVSGKLNPDSVQTVKSSEYAASRKLYEGGTVFNKKDKEGLSGHSAAAAALAAKANKTSGDSDDPQFDSIYGRGDDGSNF